MRVAVALFAVASALLSADRALSQIVNTIVNNGSTANKYDVVILGDGYRAAEQSKFDNDCSRFANDLFLKEPYSTYARYLNVHTVFRASRESGADHPDANPPIVRDTVYDATYNVGGTARCLYIRNTSQALADAALAPANEGRILVFVNDTRYGGCAGQFAVSYTGSLMSEVQIHEMGHSVGRLADEYDYPNDLYTGPEPGEVNVTRSSSGSKWSRWHGVDGIAAFEGARYYRRGLFRPRTNCLMRALNQPNCRVCSEALVLRVHQSATAIDDPQPNSGLVTMVPPAQQTFSFINVAPPSSNALLTWELDGNTVASGVASYRVDSSALTSGRHSLVARVVDRTAWVRSDPQGLLDQTHGWSIDVVGPPEPDLLAISVQPSSSTVQAGTPIGITSFVGNIGTGPAAAFRAEHFLSSDPTITADDVYLGGFDVPPLAVLQNYPFGRGAVHVPAWVLPGGYHLGLIVDRTDAVQESNEANNVFTVPVTINRAGCTPVLEFRDRLVHPTDTAMVSASTPGSAAHPTVVSPCDVGSIYVIVWGRSGTSPGTPLGPGLTLPLNLDEYTQISLMLQNSPNFASFLGTLDADGVGVGTFQMPGVSLTGDLPGHFAAAILTPALTAFTGATNPIAIRLSP